MTLFDGTLEEWKAAHQPIPKSELSADQRRTIARKVMLERGVHPTTRQKLLNKEWGFTCGDCDHHVVVGGHAKDYHKCDAVYMTSGPGTDIRLKWPASARFRTS